MMRKPINPKKTLWVIIILLVLGIAFQLVNYQLGKVKVVLYGTSTDSVTLQVENILSDLQTKFGSRLNVEIHLAGRLLEDGTIQSYQTTSAEAAAYDIEENIRQAVIKNLYPNQYADYLQVRNTDVTNTNWQYFAEFAKINADKISEQIDLEGEALFREEIAKFEEVRQDLPINANTLPLLYINDQLYKGSVDHFSLSAAVVKPILRGWKSKLSESGKTSWFGGAITFRSFSKFQHNGVSECYNNLDCDDKNDYVGTCRDVGTDIARCVYTEPAEVQLTVLNDEDCATCDTEFTIANLQADFKGLSANEIDVSSKEGEQLKEDLGVRALPVYLFGEEVEQASNFDLYAQVGYLGQVTESGDYKYTLVQSGIPGVLLERELAENQLDIFVMSQCPYSVALENSLIALAQDINFDLNVHYVLQGETDAEGNVSLKMASLGGEAEYNEDIRQLVIQKYYADKFLDYLEERNKDVTSEDWQSVAMAVGIDAADVAAKATAEGEDLLKADAQTALGLGINSAPAYLWQNRYFGFGVTNLIQFDKFSDLEIRAEDMGYCINPQDGTSQE
ncbi:MAG: hypothetical protein ABIB97_02690 [Patescibacteria group bacterium]